MKNQVIILHYYERRSSKLGVKLRVKELPIFSQECRTEDRADHERSRKPKIHAWP